MFGLNPFRKGGVPHSKEALAVLGVDVEGHKGDRGSKGSEDEIQLNEAEQREVQKAEEQYWDMNRLIAWAETISKPLSCNEEWVRNSFDFDHHRITFAGDELNLVNTPIEELPPHLVAKSIHASGSTSLKVFPDNLNAERIAFNETAITDIPEGFHCDVLEVMETPIRHLPAGLRFELFKLSKTQIRELPADLIANELWINETDISELPENIQVKKLVMYGVELTQLPEDLGALESVYLDKSQERMITLFEERGINVQSR